MGRKAKVFSGKHWYYKKTWVTGLWQEEASVHPKAGAMNVYDDSSDEDAYTGEQKEIAREVEELRVAKHWINQENADPLAEARAFCSATGQEIDLRLDWEDVGRKLRAGNTGVETSGIPGDGRGKDPLVY